MLASIVHRPAAVINRPSVRIVMAIATITAMFAIGPACAQARTTPAAAVAVRVIDDAGRTVTLPRPAKRIVSLAPSLTELLFAIGAGESVVGTSRYTDYPEAALRVPVIGDATALDVERIAALKPDLILIWSSGNSPTLTAKLKPLQVPVFYSEPTRLHQIPDTLRRFGALTGHNQQAADAAAQFRGRMTALRRQYSTARPLRVFYQVWDQPLMTVGGRQIISDAIALCGGTNIFSYLHAPAPTITVEAVVTKDPDVIVTSYDSAGGADGLGRWRKLSRLRASQPNRLIALDTPTLGRPSPRVLDGTQMLCERLQRARAGSTATGERPKP